MTLYGTFRRRFGLQRTAEERVAGLVGAVLEHCSASAALRLFARMLGAPAPDASGDGGEDERCRVEESELQYSLLENSVGFESLVITLAASQHRTIGRKGRCAVKRTIQAHCPL